MFTKRVFTHTMSPDFKEYLEDSVAAEDGITLWDNLRGYDGVHVYKKDGYYFFQLYDKPGPSLTIGNTTSNSPGLYSFVKIKLTEGQAGNIEAVFVFDIVKPYKIVMVGVFSLFFLIMIFIGDIFLPLFLVLMLIGGYWMEKKAFMGCFNVVIRPYII